VETFASGPKAHYYGKGDVIVYRLNRDGQVADGTSAVFGANVLMLVYGEAFWPTYTTGDNRALIATDSMKNFIQRETLAFGGHGLEDYCRFLAAKFLDMYAQVEGVQLTASEIPYAGFAGGAAFTPGRGDRAFARVELNRSGAVEITSGLRGFKLLRLGGSAFQGFVRDEYTTLPDIANRPLHMWLDLDWRYVSQEAAWTNGATTARVRELVVEVFTSFESGSIQQVIYQMGTKLLAEHPTVSDVHLEANNRTWDTVVERGDELGVFTDARPPYGCLGLTLRRP
jgi:urate oxidase / 2-oxo-4-hydroxy-4-carboxy-5-ureidoimidazoline decarboxylase